jgi:hypothetical protein
MDELELKLFFLIEEDENMINLVKKIQENEQKSLKIHSFQFFIKKKVNFHTELFH